MCFAQLAEALQEKTALLLFVDRLSKQKHELETSVSSSDARADGYATQLQEARNRCQDLEAQLQAALSQPLAPAPTSAAYKLKSEKAAPPTSAEPPLMAGTKGSPVCARVEEDEPMLEFDDWSPMSCLGCLTWAEPPRQGGDTPRTPPASHQESYLPAFLHGWWASTFGPPESDAFANKPCKKVR